MSIQTKSGHCTHCKKTVVVTRPGTNHILHLIISIVTLGVWLIPWLLQSIRFGGWRCKECGLPVTKQIQ